MPGLDKAHRYIVRHARKLQAAAARRDDLAVQASARARAGDGRPSARRRSRPSATLVQLERQP
jgi:hypothetical protein